LQGQPNAIIIIVVTAIAVAVAVLLLEFHDDDNEIRQSTLEMHVAKLAERLFTGEPPLRSPLTQQLFKYLLSIYFRG